MRAIIAGAALLALNGCATATMDGIMNSWHGEHVEAVVARWGYPSAEREFRGRKLYVWNESGTYIVPSFSTTTGSVTRTGPSTANISSSTTGIGGGTITGQCERILEVDAAGVVVASQWGGNNCCVMAVGGRCAAWSNPKK